MRKLIILITVLILTGCATIAVPTEYRFTVINERTDAVKLIFNDEEKVIEPVSREEYNVTLIGEELDLTVGGIQTLERLTTGADYTLFIESDGRFYLMED